MSKRWIKNSLLFHTFVESLSNSQIVLSPSYWYTTVQNHIGQYDKLLFLFKILRNWDNRGYFTKYTLLANHKLNNGLINQLGDQNKNQCIGANIGSYIIY